MRKILKGIVLREKYLELDICREEYSSWGQQGVEVTCKTWLSGGRLVVNTKCDAFFQLHTEAIWKSPKNRSDEGHYAWLKSGKTPKVYMQEKNKDVPKSVKYPIKDVIDLTSSVKLANGRPFKYLTSSLDLALALVAQMYKEGKNMTRYN